MLERLAAAFAIAGGTVLLAIAALTGINVLLTGLDMVAPGQFGVVRGYEDLVRLLVSAAVPLLFPWCQLRRGHVAVELLAEWLPAPVRAALEHLGVALTAAIAIFLAFWLFQGLLETRADGRIASVLGWPEWPFFVPALLALLLWAAVAARQLRAGSSS